MLIMGFPKNIWSNETTLKLSGHINRGYTYWYTKNNRTAFKRQLNNLVLLFGKISHVMETLGLDLLSYSNCKEIPGNVSWLCNSKGTNELQQFQFTWISTWWCSTTLHKSSTKLHWWVVDDKVIGKWGATEMPPTQHYTQTSRPYTYGFFFFLGIIKDVYATKPQTIEDLRGAIGNALKEIDLNPRLYINYKSMLKSPRPSA